MSRAGTGNDQHLTWTTVKPAKAGWYWMLNQQEEPGLPTIVQLVYDWQSRHLIALVPASRYPTLESAAVDPQKIDAVWAGPLAIPSIAREGHHHSSAALQDGGEADLAA